MTNVLVFILFSSTKENLCIFAPAIPGEIGTARESAFFALFLSSESGQFAQERGWRGRCFRWYVCISVCIHTAEHDLIHYFFSCGSPDPTAGNKDKSGRLRSVCHSIMSSFEPRSQKNRLKWKTEKTKIFKEEESSLRKRQGSLFRCSQLHY